MTDIANPSRVKLSVQRYEATFNGGSCTPELCPLAPHLSGIINQFFGGRNTVMEEYPDEFRITAAGLQDCVRREHFMLISDVSHLLQRWDNFVKWNYRLCECDDILSRSICNDYVAQLLVADQEIHSNYRRGLCPDPSEGWFEGQIGFLEKYAIPLATRAQVFFHQEFSDRLVGLGRANLALWKELGVQASSIMEQGVRSGENENEVLKNLYSLHQI